MSNRTLTELVSCRHCDGAGITAHLVTVYEHGCGFSHDDSDERPCEACNGLGGELIDYDEVVATPDCEVCGGDCAAANPPVYNCPLSSDAPLSTDPSPSSRDDSFCDPSLNNSLSRGGA